MSCLCILGQCLAHSRNAMVVTGKKMKGGGREGGKVEKKDRREIFCPEDEEITGQ